MNKNKLIGRAFLDAAGVATYAVAFAWFVNHIEKWFGSQENGWLGFAMFIMVFIISACVTASLVLLKPILLYLEGQKKDAVHLFVYTLVFLVLLALVIGFVLIK